MDFGSIRRKPRLQQSRSRKTFSVSNLSCISCNSTTMGRRSLWVTLPRDFGCDIGVDGRVLQLVRGGPAHSSGVLQVGDYVRIFDDYQQEYSGNSENGKSLSDTVTIQVIYTVILQDSRPTCPLIIEIGNRSKTSVGIALTDSPGNKIRISSIQPGSLADRCGFLKQDDILTSVHINSHETVPCSPYYTSYQIAQILRKLATQNSSITLTIFPHQDNQGQNSDQSGSGSTATLMDHQTPHEQTTFFNTYDGGSTGGCVDRKNDDREEDEDRCVLSLCLWKDKLYDDWGFSLIDQIETETETENESEENETDKLTKSLLQCANEKSIGSFVYEIRPGGPAFLSGLRPGDRVLQINDRDVSHLESTILVPILASLDDALNLIISRLRSQTS